MEEPILTGLDAALHELGMLSSVTDSCREYVLEERRKIKPTRAVKSNRTRGILGYLNAEILTSSRKKEFLRYDPYTPVSVREERIRTKSENSDVDIDWLYGSSFTPLMSSTPDCSGLFKSRSLEDVKATVPDESDENNPALEVESVSDQIQQLQVSE